MTEDRAKVNEPEAWPVISSYSRAQAIEDGMLIDVSSTAKEAGFKVPVAITVGVHGYCNPPEASKAQGQSYEGRLWDVLMVALFAARAAPQGEDYDMVQGAFPRQRAREA